MATRVEKQLIDGTPVVVGYSTTTITTNEPGEDSTGIVTHTPQDVVSDVDIDYSQYYERLASAAESMAVSMQTISEKITSIEDHQRSLRELGETTGIHVVGPYDWLSLINIYKSLIEQGNILDTQGNVDSAKQAAAESLITSYISKIQRFPNGF